MGGLLGNESLEPPSKPALQPQHPSREVRWNLDLWMEGLSGQATCTRTHTHSHTHTLLVFLTRVRISAQRMWPLQQRLVL